MTAKITFSATASRNEIVIKKINSVKIESSWKMLTDRATIILPRNVKYFDKTNVKETFKKCLKDLVALSYLRSLSTLP